MQSQIIHLLQKGICFRKLTNITFAYLLSPHQTNLYTRLHNSASNWVQIIHISQEIFSRKIDYYFCVPIVFINISKKSQRANHQIRLHNFGPNWAWPCPPKGNLLEKLTNIALVFYILSCYIIFKKVLGEQIIRFHNFCPNFPLL